MLKKWLVSIRMLRLPCCTQKIILVVEFQFILADRTLSNFYKLKTSKTCRKIFLKNGKQKNLKSENNCHTLCSTIYLSREFCWTLQALKSKHVISSGFFKDFLEYYWIFEYFVERVLLHGSYTKTFDNFCRITTTDVYQRLFDLYKKNRK